MGLESARDKHVDWSGEKLNFEFGFLDHTNNFWINLLLHLGTKRAGLDSALLSRDSAKLGYLAQQGD